MNEVGDTKSEIVELGSRILPKPLLARMPTALQLGSTAQAAVPGLYAWFVTVVPCAWGRGGHALGKVASLGALFSLAVAIYLEPQQPRIARIVSVWGLPLFSLVVWLASSTALEPQHFANARAFGGMLGWGLFAYASAAPALGPRASGVLEPGVLKPRAAVIRGDIYYLFGGGAVAVLFQTIGWHTLEPNRALLVRVAMLGAGLGVIGAAASLTLSRRHTSRRTPAKNAAREAMMWGLGIALLLLFGAVFSLVR